MQKTEKDKEYFSVFIALRHCATEQKKDNVKMA